jgi:hypothetical protein
LSEALAELTLYLGLCASVHLRPGHDHHVVGRHYRIRQPAEGLTQEPSGPVALHRAPDASTHGDPQPVTFAPIGSRDQREEPPSQPPPFPEHPVELPPLP